MMSSGIHILLTYTCNSECNHCFLHCWPRSSGTFTISEISEVLDEATRIGTVQWIFFEGGEAYAICGPLARGGPAQLAKELCVKPEEAYIGACHFCYLIRRSVIDKFADYLAPEQVYGLGEE